MRIAVAFTRGGWRRGWRAHRAGDGDLGQLEVMPRPRCTARAPILTRSRCRPVSDRLAPRPWATRRAAGRRADWRPAHAGATAPRCRGTFGTIAVFRGKDTWRPWAAARRGRAGSGTAPPGRAPPEGWRGRGPRGPPAAARVCVAMASPVGSPPPRDGGACTCPRTARARTASRALRPRRDRDPGAWAPRTRAQKPGGAPMTRVPPSAPASTSPTATAASRPSRTASASFAGDQGRSPCTRPVWPLTRQR